MMAVPARIGSYPAIFWLLKGIFSFFKAEIDRDKNFKLWYSLGMEQMYLNITSQKKKF